MLAIWMFQFCLKKSNIFFCLNFGAGFSFSKFGLCNFKFGFSSLSSFRARFATGISASTISSFRFNGALISSRSFCRSKFNFSRRAYMAQVLASLMTTMALRHAFDIPGGECRIQNVDESMCYMFNSAKRSWTVWANTSYQKIFKMIIWKGGGICREGICN